MFNKIYVKIKKYIKENYRYLLLFLAIILLFKVPFNCVIYTPGGSINLNDRIIVDTNNKTSGSFNMAYVKALTGSLPFMFLSLFIPNWDITSLDNLKYEDESTALMEERDRIYLEESVDNATISAFSLTGSKISVNNSYNKVVYVAKEAKTKLKFGDVILTANDKMVTSIDDYKSLVESLNYGDKINLQVKRDKKIVDLSIEVLKINDEKKTGISFVTLYDLETEPKVNVETKSSESGPSGGLMMALSIYNSITAYDITKGRKIIGTGTISSNGEVGEIGGVKYKVLGAINSGADIFVAPESNCEEAESVLSKKKSNMKLICVKTLSEAIYELS